jgi:probable HAF family extracellular repeat protein
MHDLGALGGTDSRAIGINNRGDIVGHYIKTDGTVHGFIYKNGQMYSLQ